MGVIMNKFEISDEILEQVGIDVKKLSPDQLKAMFAELSKKGLLNDKPGDKKSTDKKAVTEGAQGSGRTGLVKKKVTVHRGNKTFTQERWVKAGEDEPADKPKKGEDKPGDKPRSMPEPEKPKGPIIAGLNKPEGDESDSEPKDSDFAHELNVDDWVSVGGRQVKVISIDKENKKVTLGAKGSFIPDEEYDFERLNEIGSPEKSGKADKPDDKSVIGSKDKTFTDEAIDNANTNMRSHLEKMKESDYDIAERQITSVGNYTAKAYHDINNYLRGGVDMSHLDEDDIMDMNENIEFISDFIKEAPKVEGTVYRGMGWSSDIGDPQKQYDDFMSGVNVGEDISLKTFTSTSTSKDTATEFLDQKENPIVLQIQSKNGVFLNGASSLAYEREVLFDKNSKFIVKSVNKDDNITHIILDEIKEKK